MVGAAQAKKYIALGMLATGYAKLGIVPSVDGVVVPETLRGRAHVMLSYGAGLAVPPPDTCVDDEGIRATLIFGDVAIETYVPWGAVFFIASDLGSMVWPESCPDELTSTTEEELEQAAAVTVGAMRAAQPPARRERPSWLALVD